jgi:hypothetical protein
MRSATVLPGPSGSWVWAWVIHTPLRQKARLATRHRSERVQRNPLQFEPIPLLPGYRRALFARLEVRFSQKDEGPEFRRSQDIDYAVLVQVSS